MSLRTRDRTRTRNGSVNTHALHMPQDHGLTYFLDILYTYMFVNMYTSILNIFTSQNVIRMQLDQTSLQVMRESNKTRQR